MGSSKARRKNRGKTTRAPEEGRARRAEAFGVLQNLDLHVVVGLLVEAVSDILSVSDDQIQATPDIACPTVTAFVRGVIPLDGRMISLLALDNLLNEEGIEEAA